MSNQFWVVNSKHTRQKFIEHVDKICDDCGYVEFEWNTAKNRTQQQNKALHVYFRKLSEKLNEGGLDAKAILSEAVDIPWTPAMVKDLLWRKTMEKMTDKTSTRDLDRSEITTVYDVINRYLSQEFGITVEFPNEVNNRV